MTVVKLSIPDMRQIAAGLLSDSEDYRQTYGTQFASVANEMASQSMQGDAGPAMHTKVVEFGQQVARFSQMADDKAQAIIQFCDRTQDAEQSRAARFAAVSSL